jgi:hypothetical protein
VFYRPRGTTRQDEQKRLANSLSCLKRGTFHTQYHLPATEAAVQIVIPYLHHSNPEIRLQALVAIHRAGAAARASLPVLPAETGLLGSWCQRIRRQLSSDQEA